MTAHDRTPIALESSPFFSIGLAAYGLVFLALYVFALAHTLFYPYPLEIYEGSNLSQAAYSLRTGTIYTPPTLTHLPMMYTPLYYYVTALFLPVFGDVFAAGRIVSLLATLTITGIIYAWMRREAFSTAWAWAGAMTFLALYPLLGQWYQTVHVDMLMVALLMGGIYLLHFGTGRRSTLAAGLLLALSVYAKQQAALVIVPFGCAVALRSFRRACIAGTAAAAAMIVLWGFETWRSGGWFLYYTLEMPGSQPLHLRNILPPLFCDIVLLAPVMAGFVAYFICRSATSATHTNYLGMILGGVTCALLSRMHVGGWVNVLIPMWALMIVPAFLGLRAAIRNHPGDAWVLIVLAGLQAGLFFYSPSQVVPPGEYTRGIQNLKHFVDAQKGGVLMDYDLNIHRSGGADLQYYRARGNDIWQSGHVRPDVTRDFTAAVTRALANRRFAVIIASTTLDNRPEITASYAFTKRLSGDINYPVGLSALPSYVYRLKRRLKEQGNR